MALLDADTLRTLLDYDPQTGLFVRKYRVINPAAQTTVGHIAHGGYLYIRVLRRSYLAHRLAWLHAFGHWPEGELDHVNGDPTDNRIANLRVATRSQNMANAKRQRNNTTGVKGVCFDKANRKWMAYVQSKGKFRNQGRYDTLADAVAARTEGVRKAFGEFARV